ncbi:hypothetical protein BH09ACT8_BH09ACT8_45540 [soil metagenome]
MNGPNYLPSDDELRQRVSALAAHCTYPADMLRQFDAVPALGSPVSQGKAIYCTDSGVARLR